MKSFNGKTILITGALLGIGIGFAEALAAKGSNIIIVARSGDKLKEQAKILEGKYSIQADVLVSDLSQPGSAKNFFNKQNLPDCLWMY